MPISRVRSEMDMIMVLVMPRAATNSEMAPSPPSIICFCGNGRLSIDPVVLFKMVLIQHLYGLPSLRRTAEEVSANNCYRWFLGYPLQNVM